jgi:hypothetical protein
MLLPSFVFAASARRAMNEAKLSVNKRDDLVKYVDALDESMREDVNLQNAAGLKNWRRNYALSASIKQRLQIETELLGFTESASQLVWPSAIAFRDTLLAYWWQLQEKFCGNYDRPLSEHACDEECKITHAMIQISHELKIYGCVRHGSVHLCQRGVRCALLEKTPQWEMACMFSGVIVDKHLSRARDAKFDGSDHQAGFKYAAQLGEFDNLADYEYTHEDKSDFGVATARRDASSSPLEAFKKKAKRKREEEQNAQEKRRGWRFQCAVKDNIAEAENRLRVIADGVFQRVMFDRETRILYNTMVLDEAKSLASSRLATYYSQCKSRGDAPNSIEAECIFMTPYRCMSLVPLVDDNRERKSRFVTLCARLWAICHNSPYARNIRSSFSSTSSSARGDSDSDNENDDANDGPRVPKAQHSVRQTTCLYEQFCVAILYLMRYGYNVKPCDPMRYIAREFKFVPQDRRMDFELPDEDRIDMFGENGKRELINTVEPTSSAVAFGERSKKGVHKSHMFKADGTTKNRKGRTKRRYTIVGSGKKQISKLQHDKVSESDVMQPHLHSSLLTVTNVYEKQDITRGRNFLRECLHSCSESVLEQTAKSLRY